MAEELLDELGGKYFDDLDAEVRKAQAMYEQQQATATEIQAQIARMNAQPALQAPNQAGQIRTLRAVKSMQFIDNHKTQRIRLRIQRP